MVKNNEGYGFSLKHSLIIGIVLLLVIITFKMPNIDSGIAGEITGKALVYFIIFYAIYKFFIKG